jgi:hypothetical protein
MNVFIISKSLLYTKPKTILMKKKVIFIFILTNMLAIPFQHNYSNPVHKNKYFQEKTFLKKDSLILVIKKHRGDIQWEKSSDCENWTEISTGHSDTLHIGIDTLAYYRAKITEGTCLPLYSDTILVSNSSNKRVTPKYGDTLSVLNHKNDLISLIIPPYALQDTATITLIPLFSVPVNPIAKNIFPGVRILPDSLRLLKPAILRVDMSAGVPDTSMSALFFIYDTNLVYPLGNLEITDSSIQGEIYHFSGYTGGEPDGDEIIGQSDNSVLSGSSNPFDWQGTSTLVEGLLKYAELLMFLGKTEEAQKVIEKANKVVENDAKKFINAKIPDNPCGWYLTALFKFAEMVNLMIGGELNMQFSDRIGELMDLCEFRGEVEFRHQITFSAGGPEYVYVWNITGFVPYSVSTKDYKTITGSGNVDHAISGHAGECEITGSGIIPVTVTGELTADQLGFPWLEMTFHETIFKDYGVTYVCPEYTYESPQPVGNPEPTVRFMMEEGYTVIIPVVEPGATGSYVYIMHVIHLPVPIPE